MRNKTKPCRKCGEDFIFGVHYKLYCPKCSKLTRYRRGIKQLEQASGNCVECGQQLHARSGKRCQPCNQKYLTANLKKGSAHWSWKGGRISTGGGYIKVYTGRVNGISQYRLEHHIVWEQAHKRKLPKGYLVHHLNGIKDDNRPENLSAIPRDKHSVWTLVELAQKRIRELEQLHLPL